MKLIKNINESANVAQSQNRLHLAIAAEYAGKGGAQVVSDAQAVLATHIGEEKAEMAAQLARKAHEESREVKESIFLETTQRYVVKAHHTGCFKIYDNRNKKFTEQPYPTRADAQADCTGYNRPEVVDIDESLADLAKGRGEPARAAYPKTNFKRFMDNWNEKMGRWVTKADSDGNDVRKRESHNEAEQVFDVIDEHGHLVSTCVVTGSDGTKSGDITFDFYNQEDPHQDNKYRIHPERTSYVKGWEWKPITGEASHKSDQRNMFTSNNPRDTMASSRIRDGQSLQDMMDSRRK